MTLEEFRTEDPEIDPDLQDEATEDLKYYSKRKLVANWDDEDQAAINEIKNHAQTVYFDIFGNTLDLIDELNQKAQNGTNWGLLTTKDLESYLMQLSQEKITTTLQLNNIKLDALFAKYSLDDDYHKAYLEGTGTNNLREAKAHTDTISKRYAYFFRYYIHVMCEGLGKEIDGLIANLRSVLYRRGNV